MTPQEFRSFMLATVSSAEAQDALAREFDGMLDALACGFDLGVRTLIAQRDQARREAGEAEALVAEVREREQRLREQLLLVLDAVLACETRHDERGHAYLAVPARSLHDPAAEMAALREALRPIGGKAGGEERR